MQLLVSKKLRKGMKEMKKQVVTAKTYLHIAIHIQHCGHDASPLGMEVSRATAVSYVQQRATLRMV